MVGPRGFQPLTPYSESVETHTNVMKKVEKLGGLFPQPQGHKKKKQKKHAKPQGLVDSPWDAKTRTCTHSHFLRHLGDDVCTWLQAPPNGVTLIHADFMVILV